MGGNILSGNCWASTYEEGDYDGQLYALWRLCEYVRQQPRRQRGVPTGARAISPTRKGKCMADQSSMEDAADIIGKELNFIQKKLIHTREALDRVADAIILGAYVEASASQTVAPDVLHYLAERADSIVNRNQ